MKIKRIAIRAAVAGAALGISATAMAAFSTSSVFTASGHAAKVTTAEVQGHITDELMPGHWSDVEFTVTNPNSYPIVVGGVSSPEYNPAVDPAYPTCAADFQISGDAERPELEGKPTGTVVPAGQTVTLTLHDAIGEYANARNECQGVAVSLDLKVDFTVAPGTEHDIA